MGLADGLLTSGRSSLSPTARSARAARRCSSRTATTRATRASSRRRPTSCSRRALSLVPRLPGLRPRDRRQREPDGARHVREGASRSSPRASDHRFRIEHAQILDAEDIPRFAKMGVIASMQGIHCTSDLPWAVDRLGPERVAEGAYVWQKLLEQRRAHHQRHGRAGRGRRPGQVVLRLGRRARTRTASRPAASTPTRSSRASRRCARTRSTRAYGSFQEKATGSLEVGKRADLTVLSKDILSVPDAEILKAQVLMTIVDGKPRYERASAGRASRRSPAPR